MPPVLLVPFDNADAVTVVCEDPDLVVSAAETAVTVTTAGDGDGYRRLCGRYDQVGVRANYRDGVRIIGWCQQLWWHGRC